MPLLTESRSSNGRDFLFYTNLKRAKIFKIRRESKSLPVEVTAQTGLPVEVTAQTGMPLLTESPSSNGRDFLVLVGFNLKICNYLSIVCFEHHAIVSRNWYP